MSWLGTARGKKIDLLRPDPSQFVLEDIADALSRIPRFNGHTGDGEWSVLQHSMAASTLVAHEFKLETLMHDSAEAYLCDIPTPLKSVLGKSYKDVETRIAWAISSMLGADLTNLPKAVKLADSIMLMTEHEFFQPEGLRWEQDFSDGVRAPRGLFRTVPNDPVLFCKLVRHYMEERNLGEFNSQLSAEGSGELPAL